MKIWGAIVMATVALALGGCGFSEDGAPEGGNHASLNPTPEKENGERSYKFEPEDLERAEEAPQAVQEYCAGAVSEAQELGCLSHVGAGEVP